MGNIYVVVGYQSVVMIFLKSCCDFILSIALDEEMITNLPLVCYFSVRLF